MVVVGFVVVVGLVDVVVVARMTCGRSGGQDVEVGESAVVSIDIGSAEGAGVVVCWSIVCYLLV